MESETSSLDNQSVETWPCIERLGCTFNLNTQSIVNFRSEAIMNRYLDTSQYIRTSIQRKDLVSELEKLKLDRKKTGNPICFDLNNVSVTEDDLKLRTAVDLEHEKNGNEFTSMFSTSIEPGDSESSYLEFDSSISKVQAKSKKLIRSAIVKPISLAQDIEKQLTLPAFRLSKRQRKKLSLMKRNESLDGWFNMPRVTELTPGQEKDLAALRMRRVWDPKQFYKKNSQLSAGANDIETSRFFQIGTVAESSADFYNSRLTKKQRKPTIVDELINDAQLIAYNKRKLKYSMSKNGRLRHVIQKSKILKQKRKIKLKRAAKFDISPFPLEKKFKTHDI